MGLELSPSLMNYSSLLEAAAGGFEIDDGSIMVVDGHHDAIVVRGVLGHHTRRRRVRLRLTDVYRDRGLPRLLPYTAGTPRSICAGHLVA